MILPFKLIFNMSAKIFKITFVMNIVFLLERVLFLILSYVSGERENWSIGEKKNEVDAKEMQIQINMRF